MKDVRKETGHLLYRIVGSSATTAALERWGTLGCCSWAFCAFLPPKRLASPGESLARNSQPHDSAATSTAHCDLLTAPPIPTRPSIAHCPSDGCTAHQPHPNRQTRCRFPLIHTPPRRSPALDPLGCAASPLTAGSASSEQHRKQGM